MVIWKTWLLILNKIQGIKNDFSVKIVYISSANVKRKQIFSDWESTGYGTIHTLNKHQCGTGLLKERANVVYTYNRTFDVVVDVKLVDEISATRRPIRMKKIVVLPKL